MQALSGSYSPLPGNTDLVFSSLCSLLSEQPFIAPWHQFTQDDWVLFNAIAVRESVAPITCYLLRENPGRYSLVKFDTSTYELLSQQEAINAIRNAVLFRHNRAIVEKLSEANIKVILLKGADLAHTLYPEPGIRPMADIDLLVPGEQISRSTSLIKKLGYVEVQQEALPGLGKKISNHIHLRKESLIQIYVELHWSIVGVEASRNAVPMDWFWENIEIPLMFGHQSTVYPENCVYTLNPTANLLFLAAHQVLQHGSHPYALRWLLDIHRLIIHKGDRIDWPALVNQSSFVGWTDALIAALKATQECFNTPIPAELLSRAPAKMGLHSPSDRNLQCPPTRILSELRIMQSLNWYGRVLLFLGLVFPSPKYIRQRYQPSPTWIWPIYYLWRWVDIASDGIKTLITLVRRRF